MMMLITFIVIVMILMLRVLMTATILNFNLNRTMANIVLML